MLYKQKMKLLKVLSGFRGMRGAPACIILFYTKTEEIAIMEANKLCIPLVGLIDTNSDPDDLDFAIPANDDAIRSIKLFTKTFADAIIEGRARYMKNKDFLEKQEKAAAAKKGGPRQSDRRGNRPDRPDRSNRPDRPAPKKEAAPAPAPKPAEKKDDKKAGEKSE